MFILYDLIFLFFGLFYLPVLILKKKIHRGFLFRLGLSPVEERSDRPVWLHAVSVGETMAIRNLLESLRKEYPAKKFVVSTVTPTGNKIARSYAKETDSIIYLPLDLSFIVNKFIRKINPSFFIITETELWPNLISLLAKRNIGIILVNGRISDRSFKGYKLISFLIKPVLNKINLYCVQTQEDLHRLEKLGVAKEKIKVTGNMKFDSIDQAVFKKDYTQLRGKLNLRPQDKLLLAGSTHPGEEELILEVYAKLLSDQRNLKLLIAPRHPQRSRVIEKEISRLGFTPLSLSRGGGKDSVSPAGKDIFILDTIGELISYYSIADIVFMGGSLVKIGGHNLLEPAGFAKPVLFGPYMFNFRDISRSFLNNQAAIMVEDAQQLSQQVRNLLDDPSLAKSIGKKAQELILRNQGASLRNVKWIKYIFSGT